MGFNWQTDEETESDWLDQPSEPERPLASRPSRRVLLFLAACLLGLMGYTAQQALERRAAAREAQITADVLSSYKLLNQAVDEGDLEILRSVLSGSNTQWSQEQQTMLLNQQLFERPFPGWTHLPRDRSSLQVDPTFTEVQLTITQTYQISNNLTIHQAQLAQTIVFRPGEFSWLYTHPKDEFWGAEQRLMGEHITVIYPARDDDYVTELASYLDQLVGRYCLMLRRCGRSPKITITLSPEADSIPLLFNPTQADVGPVQLLELPTPSLIGRPLDKSSAQALYGTYGVFVVSALNQRFVVRDRLGQEPFDRLLLDQQLAQLNLPQQYLTTAAPEEPLFLANLRDYHDLWLVSNLPADSPLIGRAKQLIDFLDQIDPQTGPLERQQQLQEQSFEEWLIITTDSALSDVERAWLKYVHEQSTLDRLPPPDAYTEQVIGLLCTHTDNTATYVTLNHIDNPQWSSGSSLGNVLDYQFHHRALPDDSGFMIEQRPRTRDGQWYTLLVRDNGELFHTFDNNTLRTPVEYTGIFAPDNNRLLMSAPNPEFGFTEFHILDLNQCSTDNCPLTLSDGLPIWSPTGEHTLLITFQGLHLGTPDGQRVQRLGRGENPFWVDEDTFGYLRSLGFENRNGVLLSKNGLVLGDVGQEEEKQTITAASFEPIIAAVSEEPADELVFSIEYVTANQTNGRLYIVGSTLERDYFYLLEHNLASGRSRLLLTLNQLPGRLTFSPDGRWLALTAFPREVGNALETNYGHEEAQLYLLNLRTNKKLTYTFQRSMIASRGNWLPDWSADGQWLIMNDEVSLHIIAPAEGYQQRIFHTFATCQDAAWLNR